jgi:hypothetical protein
MENESLKSCNNPGGNTKTLKFGYESEMEETNKKNVEDSLLNT